jgi:hypothetical protein
MSIPEMVLEPESPPWVEPEVIPLKVPADGAPQRRRVKIVRVKLQSEYAPIESQYLPQKQAYESP